MENLPAANLFTSFLGILVIIINEVDIFQNTSFFITIFSEHIWDKVFENGPSKICGRQPLKNLKGYGLPRAVSHKFYLDHS